MRHRHHYFFTPSSQKRCQDIDLDQDDEIVTKGEKKEQLRLKIEGKREILFGMILSVEATDGGDWRRDEPPSAIMLTVVESETSSGTDGACGCQ